MGLSDSPLTATGVPRSNSITTISGTSGAFSGVDVSMNRSAGGAAAGSSSTPPSCERCQRLASRE